jgi:hypothetical protein
LRGHNVDYINNILYKYIKNNPNPRERKSKKWHRELIDYHIVTDFSNSINYHHLNQFAKTLDAKKKRISIRMHHSLSTSSKQLTRFFDAQKNLSFSLENNNTINTYIYPNDQKPIRSEPLSPPLMYSVTFSEFDENDSLNWKNNYSESGYMLFNSLDNSLSKLTSLNNSSMLFYSVLSQHKSKQHLNSAIVLPFLSPLSLVLSHSLIVDSPYTESEFSDLFLHLTYRSSTLPPSTLSPFSLLTRIQAIP